MTEKSKAVTNKRQIYFESVAKQHEQMKTVITFASLQKQRSANRLTSVLLRCIEVYIDSRIYMSKLSLLQLIVSTKQQIQIKINLNCITQI
jgi:hypothetical protein